MNFLYDIRGLLALVSILAVGLTSAEAQAKKLQPTTLTATLDTAFDTTLDEGEDRFIESFVAESLGNEAADEANAKAAKVITGISTKPISEICHPKNFESSLDHNNMSANEYGRRVREYFRKCEKELTQESTLGLLGLLEFSKYQYNFFSNPRIKARKIHLKNGLILPAIEAVKESQVPRPLILIKCGVFCSANVSVSTKAYLMHFFDQSPFNVVLMGSHTGIDYLRLNKIVNMGGWAEGNELLEVAQWLQSSWEHKQTISSLHLVGISLGGNAAVIGASLNDRYLSTYGQKLFQSVSAICPTVSLRPTLDELFGNQIIGRIMASMTKNHFLSAKEYLTDIPDLISEKLIPSKRKEVPDYMGRLMATSLTRRGESINATAFYARNNFWNHKEKVETPLFVFASKDDSVVSYDINTRTLAEDNYYKNAPNVGVVGTRYGNHCGFMSAYGASAVSMILKNFILINSPEYVENYKNNLETLSFSTGLLRKGEKHVDQEWVFTANSKMVKLNLIMHYAYNAPLCDRTSIYSGDKFCLLTRTHSFPISFLESFGARMPKTEADAQALTREFNAKISVKSRGTPINGTANSELEFSSFKY